jgi:hypothetical protein
MVLATVNSGTTSEQSPTAPEIAFAMDANWTDLPRRGVDSLFPALPSTSLEEGTAGDLSAMERLFVQVFNRTYRVTFTPERRAERDFARLGWRLARRWADEVPFDWTRGDADEAMITEAPHPSIWEGLPATRWGR